MKTTLEVNYRDSSYSSTFDKVFAPTSSQTEVFDHFKPLIKSLKQGINCCIMAYGHTGAGKTHAMYGQDIAQKTGSRKEKSKRLQVLEYSPERAAEEQNGTGLVLRYAQQLLSTNNDRSQPSSPSLRQKAAEAPVGVRFYQIYNEKVLDLLNVI